MTERIRDADWLAAAVERLAGDAATVFAPCAPGAIALVGLRTRGEILARRIRARLAERGLEPAYGVLDATLYRDDLHTDAGLKAVGDSDIPFDLTDKTVVLVDDVLATGRTIRAAMEALFSFGRPARIALIALLDRGGRELPIQPDFVGDPVPVKPGGFVRLKLHEVDPFDDAVYLLDPGDPEPVPNK